MKVLFNDLGHIGGLSICQIHDLSLSKLLLFMNKIRNLFFLMYLNQI